MSGQERTESILKHIIPTIRSHQERFQNGSSHRPFILGLTGLQGSGKSTLASDIVDSLNAKHGYRAIEISLDDFYKTQSERDALRAKYPENEMLRTRGQPGAHDLELASWFFSAASEDGLYGISSEIVLPVFDKSLFDGAGDRAPKAEWRKINREPAIDVMVFEGWCVGFLPLSDQEVEWKLQEAKTCRRDIEATGSEPAEKSIESQFSTTTLEKHSLQDVLFVNEQLRKYCDTFLGPQNFDYLVHLDTDDLMNVYQWRMGQERSLRKLKNAGMRDEQVVDFGELYSPKLLASKFFRAKI